MPLRSPTTGPGVDLERIRKEQAKPRHARLRIMIAGDPTRPIRTISLPRRLPLVAALIVGTLAIATVVLACGSWKLSGALSGVQRRMFAMVRAADSAALASGEPRLARRPACFRRRTGPRAACVSPPARSAASSFNRRTRARSSK